MIDEVMGEIKRGWADVEEFAKGFSDKYVLPSTKWSLGKKALVVAAITLVVLWVIGRSRKA